MSEEKLVPKLRFSGFTDEWNEVTLNDVATFSKGKGISKNDISNYGIECVRYGELYTKYNEMIYNIESKTDLNKNELKLSEKNDILMPCSGETAIDLATASCIQKDQVAIGGDITVIKTNQYAPFITYYLNQKKTEIAKYAQGVSIVHLYPKDFKVMNIRIPSINEQKMIIGLLEEITKKEQLLESKYQQYQEFKKYLMQQIFTQKLRFADDENWVTVTIANIFDNITDYVAAGSFADIRKNVTYLKDPDYAQLIRTADLKSNFTNGDFVYVDKHAFEYLWRVNLDEPCIVLPNIGNIGEVYYINPKELPYSNNALAPNAILLKSNDNIKFKYYLLESPYFKNQLDIINEAGGRGKFNKTNLKKIKIKVPNNDLEKEKIAKCLSNVDNKLKLFNIQLIEMQEFKKGLLQQMFVVQLILSLLQNKKHI